MIRPQNVERIAEIVSKADEDLGADGDAVSYTGFSAFIQCLFGDAAEDEIEHYTADELFHQASSFWRFSANRKQGETLLRVFNPTQSADGWSSPHTVIEIVADDMAFLVDSLLAELNALDLNLHSVLHPIVYSDRDANGSRQDFVPSTEELSQGAIRESMVHVEFDYHSDERLLNRIKSRIEEILSHVKTVVDDFQPMQARLNAAIEGLQSNPPTLDQSELEESIAFLSWLRDNKFAFLGSRIYSFEGEPETGDLVAQQGSGLGLLRDPEMRVLRRGSEMAHMTPEVREFLMLPSPIIITKANVRSVVHRRVHMDYVGVKLFDEMGQLTGEYRFVGLFTAEAYTRSISRIPLLSRKVEKVIEKSGFASASYNKKALKNILERFPRDELFQVNEHELLRVATGIVDLHERPRTKIFVRQDRYDRYVSVLVFVPRENFNSQARQQVADILVESYKGRLSAFYPYYDDTTLVRVHFIIGREPDDNFVRPDTDEVERRIVEATRAFPDALYAALAPAYGEERCRPLVARYGRAFPVGYRDTNTPNDAVQDIEKLEPLAAYPAIALRSYRRDGDPANSIRLKVYRAEYPLALSDALPILENLGLRVLQESGHQVDRGDAQFWVHDFLMENPDGHELNLELVGENFEAAFEAVWLGRAENDRFNRLCIEQNIPWRTVALLRGFAHYWRQSGRTLSVSYMQDTLANHPQITSLLVELFEARFDPSLDLSLDERVSKADALSEQIMESLETVPSLDEDRLIRQFLALIQALWRTNFYQKTEAGEDKPYISFKIESRKLEDLPLPKPLTEIFVYSTRVEGVHLRWGFVARGGLRWSDRREDFRTEILGLVKAQQVKNAVIVPVGAKGGFVPKQLPTEGGREAFIDEGIACYRLFISGLLDLADNIVDGTVVKPQGMVIHDQDDPYLVVAADKGTATFSDIANEISQSYGFWLGDAFASGGSNGYDHKAMGITARGAWEAVKRHFRELGTDIQTEPFTAVGVGDMSGDVFGNGMLLSRQTKLVAAFDHRDIFIDPDPDPETSFVERERLFALPRSSWADYDQKLISKGGGVFSRSLKAIELSPEAQKVLGTDRNKLTPNELIQSILTSPASLMWFGGIGTYIKAESERDSEVGDKANDAVRINASDLRVKVIGEGANLGVTQAGRIAFSRMGGHVNSDAIDNSAGVDCSDHEVNIKILVDQAVKTGSLDDQARNQLLEDMTDDVSELVLKNNYNQTRTLTLAEATAVAELDSYRRLMSSLEAQDLLNREVEGLPADEKIDELTASGQGLSRPESAVLMAYVKITLFDDLMASSVPDDELFVADLKAYFPPQLVDRFEDLLVDHQLRREIIATVLASRVIDLGGINFVHRLVENTGASVADITRAFVAAESAFGIRSLAAQIDALDNQVSATVQTTMYLNLRQFLRRQVRWFLRYGLDEVSIQATISTFAADAERLSQIIPEQLVLEAKHQLLEKRKALTEFGVDEALAGGVALLDHMSSACDIIEVSRESTTSLEDTAQLYFLVAEHFGLDQLRDQAATLSFPDHWDRLAVRRLMDDLLLQQRYLTSQVLSSTDSSQQLDDRLHTWLERNADVADRTKAMLIEMSAGSTIGVAKLTLASNQIRELASLVKS